MFELLGCARPELLSMAAKHFDQNGRTARPKTGAYTAGQHDPCCPIHSHLTGAVMVHVHVMRNGGMGSCPQ
jgi:hypothetical protein